MPVHMSMHMSSPMSSQMSSHIAQICVESRPQYRGVARKKCCVGHSYRHVYRHAYIHVHGHVRGHMHGRVHRQAHREPNESTVTDICMDMSMDPARVKFSGSKQRTHAFFSHDARVGAIIVHRTQCASARCAAFHLFQEILVLGIERQLHK